MIPLLAACGLGSACNNASPDKEIVVDEPASGTTHAVPDTSPLAESPADQSYLPHTALQPLETLLLESQAPCLETIESIRPILASIASYRTKLIAATSNEKAVKLLHALSTELSGEIDNIVSRNETDEMKRISDELSASIGDLAESIKLSGDALSAQNKQASASVLRRIQNGVDNTRSSIERLIEQCAS